MQIFAYDPFRHAEAVFQLWSRTLGSTYPVDRETFLAHTLACLLGRPTGAFVALARAEIIGFALTACGGESGFLEALLVAPEQQRQGVGKSLLAHAEEQLRQEGCRKLWVGRGADRFWTALPQDLPNAAAFFAATGFVAQNEVCDLVVDLREDGPPVYQDRLRDAGAEIVPCTRGMLPEVLDFEQAEFPGWVTGILRFAAKGEEANVLVVRTAAEIVGTIHTFPPRSRVAGPNLVWRATFPGPLGGYGAVGIAEAWRGKGLGIAMCEAAGQSVRAAGADFCFIDWTTIVDFYARAGAQVWRRFTMMAKGL